MPRKTVEPTPPQPTPSQPTHQILIDADVQAVAEFMQTRMAAHRLVGVASEIAALAPVIWGHFPKTDVAGLRLRAIALQSREESHVNPS